MSWTWGLACLAFSGICGYIVKVTLLGPNSLFLFPLLCYVQESENLEKENAALRKEVKRLKEEAKYLTTVLSNHESVCTGLSSPSSDLLYGAHHGYHQHIAVPHYPL